MAMHTLATPLARYTLTNKQSSKESSPHIREENKKKDDSGVGRRPLLQTTHQRIQCTSVFLSLFLVSSNSPILRYPDECLRELSSDVTIPRVPSHVHHQNTSVPF
ncbi:hypothetical protein PAXRUDRAFT_437595 [Paxillus rubicundulus Ve08.2h10]|uniref:Unplaced genomic scaffold scaffold_272, whole genome shotgun sequence n=1 Tax=Paxillus rubicundulus Ve08.2h10 TaxID=930991 RepID=A0A0D0E853_9AGAM|nr:hypothetical protein PAXRUDRAFT_437595 [Paxillus rubicundulus Ve08.2h10]